VVIAMTHDQIDRLLASGLAVGFLVWSFFNPWMWEPWLFLLGFN